MKVAILGCGPTGLLAAHACAMNYVDFDIYSRKRKSELFGSQYLHEPIPGLTEESDRGVDVKYVVEGTPEEYRRKTHGKWWGGHVAPEDFEPDHTAWDIRKAYNDLWMMYFKKITGYTIPSFSGPPSANHYGVSPTMKSSPESPGKLLAEITTRDLGLDQYDLVISTVPRNIWYVQGEEYIFSEGWALGDAPERGQFVEDMVPELKEELGRIGNNTIVCDGTDNVSWTRLSRVYGYTTIEWPHHAPQPHPDAVMVRKPLHYAPSTTTDSPVKDWLHVGRYGQFERGIVVTDAFHDVVKKLQEMK